MTRSVAVRAPASSANLGAGFDVLAMALDMELWLGVGDAPDGAQAVDAGHPSSKAFRAASRHVGLDPGTISERALWVRSAIPMARGLGFSGAARVAGAALAVAVAATDRGIDPATEVVERRMGIVEHAALLEGHGDNAAASTFGGVVAWVGDRALALRVGPVLSASTLVVWIPSAATTSTDRSRSGLNPEIRRQDAVHNLGRCAQFVLAVEHDDPSLLAGATDDRIHQERRLAMVPDASEALDAGVRGRGVVRVVVRQWAHGGVVV